MYHKSYKIKLYPTKAQAQTIDQTIGNCRFIYNEMLKERIQVYEKLKDDKEKLYAYKYKTEKEYKQEFEFLKLGSSRALQQAAKNLFEAYQNFFKSLSGKRKGEKINFPKMKEKLTSRWSYREPQTNLHRETPAIHINNNKIRLCKLGYVRFRGLSKDFGGEIKFAVITKHRDGTYYVSITAEQDQVIKPRKKDCVTGIDLGIKSFVTLSSGEQYNPPEKIKELDKKIQVAHRHFSRKQKGSKRKEKARIQLAKAYIKRSNLVNHFHWNLVNQLCSESQAIGVENLNISGMVRNKKLSGKIHHANWGGFITKLKQKAVEYGTEIREVGRFFPSSKTCSCCGSIKSDLKLSDRIFKCDCGFEIDRDINAAINLRNIFGAKSAEFVDYSRGEIVRPSQVVFDLSGKFLRSDDLSNQKVLVRVK